MGNFQPDYTYLRMAAQNQQAKRLPLYEHLVSTQVMEEIMSKKFAHLYDGDDRELGEFFANYCQFFLQMGYDGVPYEVCVTEILPGGGALGDSSTPPAIRDRQDFDRYPWQELTQLYFERARRRFQALSDQLPPGMKAVGGVGNGIFECVQDLIGFENLCYLASDDPALYELMFRQVGDMLWAIWQQFLEEFDHCYCVMRFGDDLGYKTSTMLSKEDIVQHILPQYQRIVALVHQKGHPFLLHSCGCIFDVMEPLISQVGIDAKHSNEDQIARFPEWVERYGHRIGNFGGIDTDAVCSMGRQEMGEYIRDVVKACEGKGGFAFGSGNSIPDYVPPHQYLQMNELVREIRGEFSTAGCR